MIVRRWGLPALSMCLLMVCARASAAVPSPEDQPIAFNHKQHADQKIECTDCHKLALKTRRSGLPTANLCLTCHRAIKADSPEIKKLAQYKANHQAIPWVRLYQLPGHV